MVGKDGKREVSRAKVKGQGNCGGNSVDDPKTIHEFRLSPDLILRLRKIRERSIQNGRIKEFYSS